MLSMVTNSSKNLTKFLTGTKRVQRPQFGCPLKKNPLATITSVMMSN